MDFTKNNLWDRLAFQGSVVMLGERYESLSPADRELYFAEFKVDYTKYKMSKAIIGLQYLMFTLCVCVGARQGSTQLRRRPGCG